MAWAYEGVQCYVAKKKITNHKPLYRSWNGSDHFYTTSKKEYDGLPKKYKREGIACYVASKKLADHTALYRLYRGKGDDHFYTTSVAERIRAVNVHKYNLEGTIGYVAKAKDAKHVPLYRAYNPKISDHFYTTNVKEIDNNGPSLSSNQLKTKVRAQLKGYMKGCRIYTADNRYFCPTEKVAKELIDAAKVDQKTYIKEIFDCDDFAHLLKSEFIMDCYDSGRRSMPYAMGIVWGNKPPHAMNVIVLGDGKKFHVRIIEPQSGKIYKANAKKLKEMYLMVF